MIGDKITICLRILYETLPSNVASLDYLVQKNHQNSGYFHLTPDGFQYFLISQKFLQSCSQNPSEKCYTKAIIHIKLYTGSRNTFFFDGTKSCKSPIFSIVLRDAVSKEQDYLDHYLDNVLD